MSDIYVCHHRPLGVDLLSIGESSPLVHDSTESQRELYDGEEITSTLSKKKFMRDVEDSIAA